MGTDSALKAAVRSMNDSVGPDGPVPTLLVYGAMLRLGLLTYSPTATTIERAKAMGKAPKSIIHYFT